MAVSEPAVLFVHAHPDDECILTGATLAKASAVGLRTVVVYGTRGDAGETSEEVARETSDGAGLGDRRVREAEAACEELGVARIEWLPFDDSGMAGTDTTANPNAFSNAQPDEVAATIDARLDGEEIIAVVGYDANGTYGHPDHIQVHHVARALGQRLETAWVLDATYSREYLAQLPDSDGKLDPDFAAAEDELTHFVQGEKWFQAKMAALANHLSQIPSDWDRQNPDVDGFRARFGTEWFIATPPTATTVADLGALQALLEPKAVWPGPLDGGK